MLMAFTVHITVTVVFINNIKGLLRQLLQVPTSCRVECPGQNTPATRVAASTTPPGGAHDTPLSLKSCLVSISQLGGLVCRPFLVVTTPAAEAADDGWCDAAGRAHHMNVEIEQVATLGSWRTSVDSWWSCTTCMGRRLLGPIDCCEMVTSFRS